MVFVTTTTQSGRLRRSHVDRLAALSLAAPVIAALAAYTLISGRYKIVGDVVLLAAVFSALTVLFKQTPRTVVRTTVLLIACVPIYWLPDRMPGLAGKLFAPSTALIVAGPVALAAYIGGRRAGRGGPLDLVLLLSLLWTLLTFRTNFRGGGPTVLTEPLVTVAGPFLLGRILGNDRRLLAAATGAIIAAAALLSLLAVGEQGTQLNQFQQLKADGRASEVWAQTFHRAGVLRSSSAFGQPLVFSLFLAGALILLVALPRRSLRAWFTQASIASCILVGIHTTGGRLAYGVAIVGILLWYAKTSGRYIAVALSVALATLLAQKALLEFLVGPDAHAATSTAYRGNLLSALLDQHNLTVGGLVQSATQISSASIAGFNGSVDNEYLLRLLYSGLPGLVLFATLALLSVRLTAKLQDPLYRAWGAFAVASFAGYLFVAILLQQGTFFWIAVGVLATAGSHPPTERKESSAEAKLDPTRTPTSAHVTSSETMPPLFAAGGKRTAAR